MKICRTTKSHRLFDYKGYVIYKSQTNKSIDYVTWKKVISTILEVTSEKLLEKVGGVYLEGIGYFCHWMTPVKRTVRTFTNGKKVLNSNFFSNTYWYNTAFFGDVEKYNPLKGWSLDKTSSEKIQKGLYKELRAGKKYKFYYTLVKNLNN